MKNLFSYLLCASILFSCAKENNYDSNISGLENSQARVEININDFEFYTNESIFIASFDVGAEYLSLNLTDQFGGNLQLQLSRKDWLNDKKKPFLVSSSMLDGYSDYGNMLIGKRDNNSLTGYMLSRGEFEWLEFSKELAVLSCKGFVVRPQDATVPENEVPFQGLIYFKQPVFNLEGIDEQSLF